MICTHYSHSFFAFFQYMYYKFQYINFKVHSTVRFSTISKNTACENKKDSYVDKDADFSL